MSSFIVCYDLEQEGQNYDCLYEKLKEYPTNWHIQRSVWIVVFEGEAKQIREHLKPCLDSNDKLFVAKLSGQAAWRGYKDKVNEWLHKYL